MQARTITFFSVVLLSIAGHAQLVGKKNLMIAVGAGGVLGAFESERDALNNTTAFGGNVTVGAGYAFNQHWGLGMRWDRSGHESAFDTLARASVALFQLHGIYRPWQSASGALEIESGLGASALSFRGDHERVPLEARSSSLQLGVRYLGALHRSLLGFCALRGCSSFPAPLLRDSQEGSAATGPVTVRWQALWLSAGFAVRW